MTELIGTAKTIFDEVMDEIDEEITDSFSGLLDGEEIQKLVATIQESTKEQVVQKINKYYSDNMSAVKKLILGEHLSRVVTAEAKKHLESIVARFVKSSFVALEELRNEIIGEVFEETESD